MIRDLTVPRHHAEIGALAGMFAGSAHAIVSILSSRYLTQRIYYLALSELASDMLIGLVAGIVFALLLFVLGRLLGAIYKGLVSPAFEINVVIKKGFAGLARWLILMVLCACEIWTVLRYVVSPTWPVRSFVIQSAFILLSVVLFRRIRLSPGSPLRHAFSFLISDTGRRRLTEALIVITLVFNVAALIIRATSVPNSPNIILVVMDAMRADRLGCYGSRRDLTPSMDALAARSLVFPSARSNAPWTKPAIASLFTALDPRRHGAYYWWDRLARSQLTLAEVLRNLGYRTFAVQANPIISAAYDFDQGFEYYDQVDILSSDLAVAKLISRIGSAGGRPFFAYIHLMDTHFPYGDAATLGSIFGMPEPTLPDMRLQVERGLPLRDRERLIDVYDRSVTAIDAHIGALKKYLEKTGLINSTILILTADHGEELLDHRSFEHGHSLYQELVRIPLIITVPGAQLSESVPCLVQLSDVAPLVLGLADIHHTGLSEDVRGLSLACLRLGGSRPVYYEDPAYGPERAAVECGEWKLIFSGSYQHPSKLVGSYKEIGGALDPESYELYNTRLDPGERNNLAAQNMPIMRELTRLLNQYLSGLERPRDVVTRDPRAAEREALRSLGYLK